MDLCETRDSSWENITSSQKSHNTQKSDDLLR